MHIYLIIVIVVVFSAWIESKTWKATFLVALS